MSVPSTEAIVVYKVVTILAPLLYAQSLLYLVPVTIFPTCSRFFWLGLLVLPITVTLIPAPLVSCYSSRTDLVPSICTDRLLTQMTSMQLLSQSSQASVAAKCPGFLLESTDLRSFSCKCSGLGSTSRLFLLLLQGLVSGVSMKKNHNSAYR